MVTRWRRICSIILGVGLSCSGVTASAQSLPPGEGLELISLVCTQCHGVDYIIGASGKLTREGWDNALSDMIARGAPVEEKDRQVLLKYLQDNLASQ